MTQKENSLFSFSVVYIWYSQKVDETVILRSVVLAAVELLSTWNSVCLFSRFHTWLMQHVWNSISYSFTSFLRMLEWVLKLFKNNELFNFTDLWCLIWWSVLECKIMACCEIVSRFFSTLHGVISSCSSRREPHN